MSPETAPHIPVQPITPAEVTGVRIVQLPGEVIQVFNELIAEKSLEGTARVKQDDVVDHLVGLGLVRREIFEKGWLNVEDVYREAGWKVEYDKPGYNETYPATFTFRIPR